MSITRIIKIGMLGTMENRALPVMTLFIFCSVSPISFPRFHARYMKKTDCPRTYKITMPQSRNMTGEFAMVK